MQLKTNSSSESSYKQPHTGTQTYVGLLVSNNIRLSCTKFIVQDEYQFTNYSYASQIESVRKTYYYNNKKVLVYGHSQTLLSPSIRPQVSAFDHVPSLRTTLSGRLLTPEWAPFDTALVPQGSLRLISCSPKLLFSYYSGAVLSNSL